MHATHTWLWVRVPLSVELQRFRFPRSAFTDEEFAALQHRYRQGDCVQFAMPDAPLRTGTAVQDQGLYLAIDGDIPRTAHTMPKTRVWPETGSYVLVTDKTCDPARADREPDERALHPQWRASWTLDGAHGGYALMEVTHVEECFSATLCSITREADGEERTRTIPPIVVHAMAWPRPSRGRFRECYDAGLRAIRDAVAAEEPAVLAHFASS
ncbi:hypothetical protein FPZ12_024075 [Amycolatopsis acidicola]|uniref:Uncharacterized protein n=1 Tax=Amycolatopsis acidicola TaxID=2596893 RepID=A0A5N0UYL9_9PSEU|nr:hypothetical protein [Amycolatopsis acidicola]KAA9157964.1 hypothetical protein FPZ12_024075 [Amycolatopsis acidicola]